VKGKKKTRRKKEKKKVILSGKTKDEQKGERDLDAATILEKIRGPLGVPH